MNEKFINCMSDFHTIKCQPNPDSIVKLTDRFSFLISDRENWFLGYCACKHFPTRIRNLMTLKPTYTSKWAAKNGYGTRHYPNGKVEFTQYGIVLETLKELP